MLTLFYCVCRISTGALSRLIFSDRFLWTAVNNLRASHVSLVLTPDLLSCNAWEAEVLVSIEGQRGFFLMLLIYFAEVEAPSRRLKVTS